MPLLACPDKPAVAHRSTSLRKTVGFIWNAFPINVGTSPSTPALNARPLCATFVSLSALLCWGYLMASFFEYCFYAGIVVGLVGAVWFAKRLFRSPRRLLAPICLMLLGLVLLVGPALISRTMSVELGKRERIVNNERHISLTGWDGEGYTFLQTIPDTVVLQMGNADVDDKTLDLLRGMSKLRELDLNDSSITDDGLAKIAKLPSLRTLRLRGTKITDAGFHEHLMNLPTLKQLDLRQTNVEMETVEAWKNGGEARRAFH